MVTAFADKIVTRYAQRDMNDLRRVTERWHRLLTSNAGLPLSSEEMEILRAVEVIRAVVRQDAAGTYRLTMPQMAFVEINTEVA